MEQFNTQNILNKKVHAQDLYVWEDADTELIHFCLLGGSNQNRLKLFSLSESKIYSATQSFGDCYHLEEYKENYTPTFYQITPKRIGRLKNIDEYKLDYWVLQDLTKNDIAVLRLNKLADYLLIDEESDLYMFIKSRTISIKKLLKIEEKINNKILNAVKENKEK